MSNLVEYAKKELTDAGYFDDDSDYDGAVGDAVLELIETFSKQGHSGYSAQIVLHLFCKLANFKPLTELKNPMEDNSYTRHEFGDGLTMLQSTRNSAVFSDDLGVTWYDVNKEVPWYKKIFGVRKAYLTFTPNKSEE